MVQTKLANHISCLDVSPTGEYPDYSHGVAVGLWNGSVMILSLPELAPISEQNLGIGDWTAAINSVLIKEVPWNKPVTLYTFFTKKNKCVIAASNMSTVVYCTYNKLDIKGNLEASHTSPFGSSSFPYHTAIAKEDVTIIGTVHDKTCISFKPLENRACCVCHQRESQTFAIEPLEKLPCNLVNCQMTKHLSPHQFMSFTSLRMVAPLLFVPSTGDSNIYYCIGTAYVLRENEPTKKETTGAVYSLNAFNDSRGFNCCRQSNEANFLIYLQASNVHLLQHEEAAIRQQACDENAKWISAVAILDEGIYLGFENNFNLFIVR
ncbi:DNA damage-binding protein 1a [Citrus sinensis]|uniref:DNA damage-binding protein 1a n=1 Tax=Citrus sinensis TaxID=2711 RepID=A0ACB8MYU0_CITSI|nr:DNA damage-binding protein 1a [Citrus sinensis]